MRRVKHTGAWAWKGSQTRNIAFGVPKLAVAVAMLAIGVLTSQAEVSVTETPTRVTVENESVRLVFDPTVNYVPAEGAIPYDEGWLRFSEEKGR